MSSDKNYLNYVLDRLSGLDEITYRPMMGEYVIYYRGKVVGGIYDDRLLLKPTKTAEKLMASSDSDIRKDYPYDGAKPMLLVDADDAELACRLIEAVYNDLPIKKPGIRKKP